MNGRWLRRTVIRSWRIASFLTYISWDFLKSNVQVLAEVVRPRLRNRPAVLEIRLASRTDLEVVALANLITLTPGSLTLEVFRDPPTLFVHGMFVEEPEEFQRHVHDIERRLLAALRPVTDRPPGRRPAAPTPDEEVAG
ncbi:MAG TPA: Na+/H+ antiporter subunit E [Natronosporangium sp.]|nr:Na+/H+ antiporter subunit E [Natronosporangium sp.]